MAMFAGGITLVVFDSRKNNPYWFPFMLDLLALLIPLTMLLFLIICLFTNSRRIKKGNPADMEKGYIFFMSFFVSAKKIRQLFSKMEYKSNHGLLLYLTATTAPEILTNLFIGIALLFLPGLVLILLCSLLFIPFKFTLNSAIGKVEIEDTIVEIEKPQTEISDT